MMTHPSGRHAPDSVLPPNMEADLRHVASCSPDTTALVQLALKQLFIEFVADPCREKSPELLIKVASLPDDLRVPLTKSLRDRVNALSRRGEHRFTHEGINYAVEIIDYGRQGFLLKRLEQAPSRPISER